MISFSTCWNSGRHRTGQDMLKEIVDLGFRNVELGHGIRLSLMEGIQAFCERGEINLTSLHNFCPLPVEVLGASPNCYEYTSHQRSERERALRLTCRTIDFAERLGAEFVVLHLGRVFMPRFTRQLIELAEDGKYLSREFVRTKIRGVRKREAKAQVYLNRVKDALTQIAEYAASKNVHLGVESREAYEEIPSERELPALLDEIDSPYVGYWHDIGHIQIKENLSFINHAEWLTKIRSRMFGCHLHDVVWPANDHMAPFSGSIDYHTLVPLMPENCLFVWEMSPRRTRDEIVEAREKWKETFGE